MRCPRCQFDGELIDGSCPQCGYQRVNSSENLRSTSTASARSLSLPPGGQTGPLRSPSMPLSLQTGSLRTPSMSLRALSTPLRSFSLYTAKSGDLFHQGRYRLVDQIVLPDNQQGQGAAWLAIDTLKVSSQVVIREVVPPGGDQENRGQIVRMIAIRLSEAGRHVGFSKVLDVFNEQNNYFIVLQHLEGESLASLLRRQGGALPERTVAEYGRQLCEMLAWLASQQSPMAHGAISPETVIVSPDRNQVHLIHFPLFPPKDQAHVASIASYKAPEQTRNIADSASDLYSVAATMHHAVTGFDPRERIAFFYPPARRLNPTVSQHMEIILAQELRLSAPQRYVRAADMQKDLIALLATKAPEIEKKPAFVSKDSFKLDMLQMRQKSRQRSQRQLIFFSAICLLLLASLLFYYLLPILNPASTPIAPTPNAAATTNSLTNALSSEWQTEASLYQTKQLGLSDGRYVFDIYEGRPSADSLKYKKLAAQALLNNDLATASNDYQEAVTYDRTDAEAQIYNEDLQIATQKAPYVTIVLGLPLDSSPPHLSLARPDLQAAYEFQNRVNTQSESALPGGVKLRILIANSGVDNKDVATLAGFIARRVQIGNVEHIVGVVGWPTSGESSNASAILTAAKIPMVTQTASSITLDGISQYFFRVNPNDNAQGQAAGKYAYNVLKARSVLVLRDAGDTYSQSLADTFTSSFEKMGGKVIDNKNDYFSEQKTAVDQYAQKAVHDARINQVDLIFLPGFDDDAVRLAHALGREANIFPFYLSKMKILGGDGFDTGLILGNGVGPDATLAHDYPQDMQRLVFTSFANSAEWGKSPPAFLTNWQKLYGAVSESNPYAPVPINTAIMTSDAFGVIAYAMKSVSGPLTGESLRAALAGIGQGNIQAFPGLSGSIAFSNDGNPRDKAVVLLAVAPDNTSGKNTIQLVSTNH